MTKAETEERINHHRVKNEAYSKNWERSAIEPKGQSAADCANQEKEHPLKNIEETKDSCRWIDNAEMDNIIKYPYPNPKEGQNS